MSGATLDHPLASYVYQDATSAAPGRIDTRTLADAITGVLEDRYGTRSTIVTSQLPPKRWHEHIAEPTHADAICDRLIHNAHRLVPKGPSKRKPEETENDK